MRKNNAAMLAIMTIPFLIPIAKAGTTYIGQIVQAVSVSSLPLPTGAATEATLSTINGKITAVDTGNVTITGSLPAGTNAIGKLSANSGVDIGDVTIDNAAGASAVNIQDGGNSITVDGTVSVTGVATAANQTTGNSSLSSIDGKLNSLGQKAMAASVPVVLASDQSAISVIPSLVTSANVTKANVSATGTSAQLVAAAATRTGIECSALCTNTDYVFLNINSASAATTTDYPMSPCSSWVPPSGMVPVGAIQVIAASGTQVVRCVSYTP